MFWTVVLHLPQDVRNWRYCFYGLELVRHSYDLELMRHSYDLELMRCSYDLELTCCSYVSELTKQWSFISF